MTALTQREQVAAAAVAVFLLLLLFRAWRRRRALIRRLSSISARLTGPGAVAVDGRGGLERTLSRLEHAAQEGALRVSDADEGRHRLAFVIDQVSDGVVVWDEHGAELQRNERATQLLADIQGEALAGELVARLLTEALGGGAGTQTIDVFGPPRRTLVVTAFPLDDGRRSLGAAAVIGDVSAHRRLESVRRDFVTNIGQRLRTPVGALGLVCQTLADERDSAVQRRLALRVHAESARLVKVIEDLLDLSQIEAEAAPLREPVPVHLLVAEAAEVAGPMAAARRVTVEVDEPDHRLTVLGDRRQLVGAMSNLIDNAVTWSPAGASVLVTADTNGGWLTLTVKDAGAGIPARDLDRIFERFYRVERGREAEAGGAGLGLSIVRHVAANHGGDVAVESTEGEGSTFTLRLPCGPTSRTVLTTKAG